MRASETDCYQTFDSQGLSRNCRLANFPDSGSFMRYSFNDLHNVRLRLQPL